MLLAPIMILSLQNISFSFTGKAHILGNISIHLEKEKIYSLMGANGAGKTTLFNLLCGFLEPQSGYIYFKNILINNKAVYKINLEGIGRIFQDLRLITNLTVKENIVLAMHNNPTEKWFNAILPKYYFASVTNELNNKADSIIERFFLEDVKNSSANEISYGQQKLLTLACCIANDADLLLLDEPVAGINQSYREKITHILIELKAEGKTIFLIEHNTDFIEEVSDKIFFLDEGKIKEYDSLTQLKSDTSVLEAYM